MVPVAAQAALSLLASAALARAGQLAWRRAPRGEGRLAGRMLALWWFGAGVVVLVEAARGLLAAAGVLDPGVHEALLHLHALPLSVGLCGLLYHLAYLYTGNARLLRPLAATCAALFVLVTFTYASLGPWRVARTAWGVRMEPASPDPVLGFVLAAAFATPALVAAAAYLRLYGRVPTAEQRYRVATVSAAFLALSGMLLAGLAGGAWSPAVHAAPALAAAVLAVAAYRPPAWVRRRLTPAARP